MPSTKVQAGESLWTIAKKKGVDWLSLVAANPQISDPNLIQPGQQIRIPTERASEASRSRAAVRTGISPGGTAAVSGTVQASTLQQPAGLGSGWMGMSAPQIVSGTPAPQLTQPTQLVSPYTGRRPAAEAPQKRQPTQLVSPYTGRTAGGEAVPTPRKLTYAETMAMASRMGAKAGGAAVRGAQSLLSAAASALPQPYEALAQGAIAAGGALGQQAIQGYYGKFIPSVYESWGRRPPVTQTGPGQGRAGAPMFPQASAAPGTQPSQLISPYTGRGMAQDTMRSERAVTGTRPTYQSPDVQQLQEQNWDRHVETVALQLLTGQGFPTYTMSRIVDDPRFRDTIIAYFAAAGVDVSGLATADLLDVMGYKYVDGDIWYRSDNGAATGGVGTFGGTTYFGGVSGGGGRGRVGAGGGGGSGSRAGTGFSYGLVDWRVSA